MLHLRRYAGMAGQVALPRLREQRIRVAFTQEALAHKAGVARTTITRLESGGSAHLSTVRRLARALRCRPDELMQVG